MLALIYLGGLLRNVVLMLINMRLVISPLSSVDIINKKSGDGKIKSLDFFRNSAVSF